MNVFPRFEPGSQGYKKRGLTTRRHGHIHISVCRINVQGVSRRFGTLHHVPVSCGAVTADVVFKCRDDSELYTCTDQNPDGPKRDEKTDRHTRSFVGQRRMAILCRPELVLFPACCCVIMFRLVCCFRYSWCVPRLMRAGPRRDWPRRKCFRTRRPYHRLASFFPKPHTNIVDQLKQFVKSSQIFLFRVTIKNGLRLRVP